MWAKSDPYHPLWKHLLDVAAVSLGLPNPAHRDGWSKEQVAWVTALHDVGKADAAFQFQDDKFKCDHRDVCDTLRNAGFCETGDAKCRHERLSAKFVRTRLEERGVSPRCADTVQRALLAHHGHWNEGGRGVGESYEHAQNDLCHLIYGMLNLDSVSLQDPPNHSATGMRLAGHIVLCDWIASNEEYFLDSRLNGLDDPHTYFAATKQAALEWIKKLELERTERQGSPEEIVEKPRPLQQEILDNDIPPGLVIIEAPMGEGKTEAAWMLAEKWREQGYNGMYMALPTMATSDSLHQRYRDDYLKLHPGESTHLVHGMAWLRGDLEPEKPPTVGEPGDDRTKAAEWFRPTRRAMLAQHGVGTVDQAMLAGMNVKFGFLRLYGLDKKVLVIDEVHAYDAYMSAIIGRLLQWCASMKIPVILLSATLSAKQRQTMIDAYSSFQSSPTFSPASDGPANVPYPLITCAPLEGEAFTIPNPSRAPIAVSATRTLKFETLPGLLGDAKKTAKEARDLVKDGGCCCVILNTVKQAQEVYKALTEGGDNGKGKKNQGNEPLMPKDRVLLFHSRFTAADRERITKDVLDKFGKDTSNRPKKFILVATQVVEQSLDVDFDHMITEIAPLDLLLQRSGRVKRHPRTKDNGGDDRGDPALYVLLPETEKKVKGETKPVDKPDFKVSEKIYERYPLLTTLAQINGIGEPIPLPADFRKLIEATYADSLPTDASDDLKAAKVKWDDLQEELAAQTGEFLLCEPMPDEFDPVGHDEVGDDTDDGNGWRARTRLGLEDVLVIPILSGDPKDLAKGEIGRDKVKELYKLSVKIPPYYWPPRAASGYDQPLPGEKKLKGAWLLPVKPKNGGWEWQGVKEDGKQYRVSYESPIATDGSLVGGAGLTHGGDR